MLNVLPPEYLRQGFLTPDGKLRDGINGEHSLAIAYQTREQGVDLDRFHHLLQQSVRAIRICLRCENKFNRFNRMP
jgi:hypothetical protein